MAKAVMSNLRELPIIHKGEQVGEGLVTENGVVVNYNCSKGYVANISIGKLIVRIDLFNGVESIILENTIEKLSGLRNRAFDIFENHLYSYKQSCIGLEVIQKEEPDNKHLIFRTSCSIVSSYESMTDIAYILGVETLPFSESLFAIDEEEFTVDLKPFNKEKVDRIVNEVDKLKQQRI